MYADSAQFSKNSFKEMKRKYIIPSARGKINQYVAPMNKNQSVMSQERGEEFESSLYMSCREEN